MLAQKQALLTDAISETKEKLDILKMQKARCRSNLKRRGFRRAVQSLKRELGRTEVELANLEEAARQTDTAIEELGKSSKLSGEKLKEAEEKAGDFKETLGDLAGKAETAAKAMGPVLLPPLHMPRNLKQIVTRL